MRQQLQERADRVAELEEKLRNPPPPTEEQLLESLGAETARVLRSAQQAAEDIRTNATDRADKELREAREQADGMRSGAEEAAETRTPRRRRRRRGASIGPRRPRPPEADAESDAAGVRARASGEAAAEVEAPRTGPRHARRGPRRTERISPTWAGAWRRPSRAEGYEGGPRGSGNVPRCPDSSLPRPPRLSRTSRRPRPRETQEATAAAANGPSGGAGGGGGCRRRRGPGPSAPTAGAEATVGPTRLPGGNGAPAEAETPGPTAPGSRTHEGRTPRVPRRRRGLARLRANRGGRPEPARSRSPWSKSPTSPPRGAPVRRAGRDRAVRDRAAEIESAVIGSAGTEPPEAGAPEPVEAAHEARPGTGGSDERPAESPHQGRLRHRDTALAPLHRNLARRSKRMLQDEQNSLLDRLRTAGRRVEPGATLTPLPETLGAWSVLIRSRSTRPRGGEGLGVVRPWPAVAAPVDSWAACAAGQSNRPRPPGGRALGRRLGRPRRGHRRRRHGPRQRPLPRVEAPGARRAGRRPARRRVVAGCLRSRGARRASALGARGVGALPRLRRQQPAGHGPRRRVPHRPTVPPRASGCHCMLSPPPRPPPQGRRATRPWPPRADRPRLEPKGRAPAG